MVFSSARALQAARNRVLTNSANGVSFLSNIFTDDEIRYCLGRKKPEVYLARKFAGKEAVFKALTLDWTGPFSWRWIEIQRDKKRLPSVVVDEELLSTRNELRSATIAVSITHAGEYAAAVALLTSA